jgi:hypothetical protein
MMASATAAILGYEALEAPFRTLCSFTLLSRIAFGAEARYFLLSLDTADLQLLGGLASLGFSFS